MDKIETFKKALHSGIVKFKYKKLSGEIRSATGTTKLDALPIECIPSGNGKPTPANIVKYFDLTKNAWRSFRFENLIEW
jgi:hypothetical protein